VTRGDVTDALYQLLTGSGEFATTGRRLLWHTDVKAQPALFLRNAGENWERVNTRMPARVTMEFEVWLYSNRGADPDFPPSAGLNQLVGIVGGLIDPFPLAAQTLGGLVTHCWIEGHVDMDPGDMNGQAIAIVPVRVLVPSFGG
jgi:hypothetical protein